MLLPNAHSDLLVRSSSPLGLLAPLLFAAPALAKDGELGLLEGRTAALVHPFFMGLLFLTTLYAGFSGYQWRRARTIQEEVKALKAQLPKADDSGAVAAVPAGLQSQISALEQERKDILASGPRDKHWAAGSWLLGAGVLISVEGAVNTYIRTGKLFPGPHLYAGAIITVLWALAAALVPAMQKGDENARRAHIALNVTSSLMFISQIPTGLEIVDKVRMGDGDGGDRSI